MCRSLSVSERRDFILGGHTAKAEGNQELEDGKKKMYECVNVQGVESLMGGGIHVG